MDLQACRRVVLFGGSFDPPHIAHIALPLLAMHAIGADAVAYLPAATAPHKRDRIQTPAHQRLEMLRLALAGVERTVILTDELDRAAPGVPSYTVDTLEALRRRLGDSVQLRLLIGADMFRIFPQWREPERIETLAEPLVMVRPPDTREKLLASIPTPTDRDKWSTRLIDLPQLEISSSDIRAKTAEGAPIDGLVPRSVVDYIARESLYLQK